MSHPAVSPVTFTGFDGARDRFNQTGTVGTNDGDDNGALHDEEKTSSLPQVLMSAKSKTPGEIQSAATELCWVVALDCEARPIIDVLGMKRCAGDLPWPVYAGRDGTECLVVSGIGRAASAAATGYLAALAAPPRSACWLNFGIAGHPTLELGEMRRAGKVNELTTGRVWYPPEVTRRAPRAEVLTTVDRPGSEFPGGGLVEMEAAGFFPTASRLATRERVQVVKVVSDNAEETFEHSITPAKVSNWVTDGLSDLLNYADALREIAREVDDRSCDRTTLLDGVAFRLTVTQKRQFERLIERLEALGGVELEKLSELWHGVNSGREALRILEAEVVDRPIRFE